MSTNREGFEKRLFVVLGFCLVDKGKPGWAIYPIESRTETLPDDVDTWSAKARVFQRKGVDKYIGSVGSVYEIEASDKQIALGSARYIQPLVDCDLRVRLGARSAAREQEYEAAKRLEKLNDTDHLRLAMEPLRRAYANTSSLHRAQLLAMMVAYITRSYTK